MWRNPVPELYVIKLSKKFKFGHFLRKKRAGFRRELMTINFKIKLARFSGR